MTSFSELALEKKLGELNNSQQSIQTLSLWLIHHRKHHKTIIQVWYRDLVRAKVPRRLTFMYLANDVIQNSKKKGPEFTKEFGGVLAKAFQHVAKNADEKIKGSCMRLLTIWQERGVYTEKQITEFKAALGNKIQGGILSKKPKRTAITKMVLEENADTPKTPKIDSPVPTTTPPTASTPQPPREPPDAEGLIKALGDLENSASSDAAVREKIASLPPEVSDTSLLVRIQDRAAAEKLLEQVLEACSLLVDYNGRLNAELEERRQVAKMLTDYTAYQKEQLAEDEKKKLSPLQEYQSKLLKVTQVRSELKSHIQNLPDLTLLPAVTGGLAPLPSAGDLFNLGDANMH